MRLWTIQRAAAWEAALRRGVLRADGRRVWRDFREAYHWLMEQMAERVPGYDGRYPVWAWAHKPDLRGVAYLPRGERGVRVEFEVPDERVLLSDFEVWHCVLNRMPVYFREREYRSWFKLPGRRTDAASLSRAKATWPRVFDLAALRRSSPWRSKAGERRLVQATLDEVRLDEVVSTCEFVAR